MNDTMMTILVQSINGGMCRKGMQRCFMRMGLEGLCGFLTRFHGIVTLFMETANGRLREKVHDCISF